MRIFGRKKTDTEAFQICEGIRIDERFREKEENRIHTLLLKGLLVYLMAMGSIGSYLSAVGIAYHWFWVNLILFVVSLLCALCFYRKLFENAGYFFMLLFAAFFGYRYRMDINHGFYVVVNRTIEYAAEYFNLNAARTYEQQVENPYQAVTISIIFIGMIFCVLLNVLITRHMQYVIVFPLTAVLLLIPLYMNLQTGPGYLIMLLTGLALLFILRGGKSYQITGDNRVYQTRGKQRGKVKIKSIYNISVFRQIFAVTAAVVVLMVLIVYSVVPGEHLLGRSRANIWKKSTQERVEIFAASGLEGFFNRYDSTGGMNHGRLGGVGSVSLDYQTDLEVTFTPYTYERLYLKSYDGVSYLPYENRWEEQAEGTSYDKWMHDEALNLQEAYESEQEYTAKGQMKITDVVEGRTEVYIPYYTARMTYDPYNRNIGTVEYYPRFPENTAKIWTSISEAERMSSCLEIPDENYSVIADLCESLNIRGTPEEITEQIASYFQENIPYTYAPGKTPENKDFVNYFLTERKKGLCTHFASAAVLMFRCLGIPARYAEGYVIDYNEVLEGTLTEERYEDYYDGYSQLGKTGVVTAEVTDADAHAWVEIFTPEKGWHPVEVTPSTNENAGRESFWGTFLRMFESGEGLEENTGGQDAPAGTGEGFWRGAGKTVTAFVIGCLCAGALYVIAKYLRYVAEYRKADRNDRLILAYRRYLLRMKRGKKELKNRLNYEDQIQYLEEQGHLHFSSEEEKERMLRILNQAGFSDREISGEECEEVLRLLKKS